MRESLYETANRLEKEGFGDIAKAVRKIADKGMADDCTAPALFFRK
jgi:hypothetical protein